MNELRRGRFGLWGVLLLAGLGVATEVGAQPTPTPVTTPRETPRVAPEAAATPGAETTGNEAAEASLTIDLNDPEGGEETGEAPKPEARPITAPPLSIYESRLMLREAAGVVRQARARGTTETLGYAGNLLDAIGQHVERVDRAHPSLPYYTWREVANGKVSAERVETLRFRLRRGVPNVTALALNAHHGDVEVARITVIDQDGEQWLFHQPMRVRGDHPRWEVCFLSLPTDVVAVTVECRRTAPLSDRRPRLFVHAGTSSRPESAKQAIYYLKRARHHIATGELVEAIASIERCDRLLFEYQKDRGL